MPADPIRRRLAAILAADVVGYSRLMGANEEGTLAALNAHRSEAIDPAIARFRGRLFKTTGDGMLVEFASAVDAVRCAVAIQESVGARNEDVVEDHRITFRIGVHLGDVMVQDDDVYGDGVNIAARLEGIAEPGGVCISDDVHRQVRGRIEIAFDDLGAQDLKNIAEPVEAFGIRTGTVSAATPAPSPAAQPAATSAAARSAGKPSIVVLPFQNMSADPDQEFFTDGISEDIITELSRYPSLFVIARHTAFTFKGKSIKASEVGGELGVDYVLEGSVRKAGNRVRITAQLIEAATDNHVWAERYDRQLDDIFEVQDEVTQSIVATLPGRLQAADAERVKTKPAENLAAYDHMLRGKIYHHRFTKEDNALGLAAVDQAIELDPNYAEPHAWKSCLLGQALARGFLPEEGLFDKIVENVNKAVKLDNENTECHRILCEIAMWHRDFDRAVPHSDKALSLNPNDPRIVAQKGELLTWTGDPEAAVEVIEQALALDPFGQDERIHLLGYALYTLGRYQEAAEALKRVANPKVAHLAFLAASRAELEDDGAASALTAEILCMNPEFTITSHVASIPYRNPAHREHYRASLAKAGLPE